MKQLVVGLVVAFISFDAQSEDAAKTDAWLILEKTAHAARELSYAGQFTYQSGSQSRSVQITHMNRDGHEMARNVVVDGPPREVYSQGSDIVIFQPKNEKVMIEKRRGQNLFPAMLPTDLQLVKSTYTARVIGTDMVAGRSAQIVELAPKDAFRYSYKIWADTEFGLLLKMTLLNNKNDTLEQIYFSQLGMITSQDPNWFQPRIDVSKDYVLEATPAVTHSDDAWIVAQLPAGYRKVDQMQRMVPGKPAPVNQIIFSDGIASVSVFIEPLAKGVRPKTGHMIVGSTNICAHVMDGYQVMVIGEVPAETVLQVAKAVTIKKQVALDK